MRIRPAVILALLLLTADGLSADVYPRQPVAVKGYTFDITLTDAGNGIAVPPTVIVSGVHDLSRAADELGFPLVVKVPDSSFSRGVKKVDNAGELDAQLAAFAVAGYIVAAYWFTSSTSFANPAVTIARSLTDTFAGIDPSDVPVFVVLQLVGGLAAVALFRYWRPTLDATDLVVPHEQIT